MSENNQQDSKVVQPFTRRQVRSLIFHILYALDAYDYQVSIESIINMLNKGFEANIDVAGEIFITSKSIADQTEILDGKILAFLNGWKIDRLGQCTKIILRIGMWELFNTYTPGHIVINEAVELAQGFSEKDAYKFVNGLLDKAFKLREASVLE